MKSGPGKANNLSRSLEIQKVFLGYKWYEKRIQIEAWLYLQLRDDE